MRVLVVDDNPIMRAGLDVMLRRIGGVDEVVEARDGQQALAILKAPTGAPIDLVFLDIRMPGMDGLAALEQIDHVPVIMLTNADDADSVHLAMERGANGYLVNGEFTEEDLATAIRLCRGGGLMLSPTAARRTHEDKAHRVERFSLTERERDLIQALAEGLSNHQIATRLHLSEHTVKNQLNRIYTKMGANSRSQAIIAWMQG